MKVTVLEVRSAYKALHRIGEENRLSQKAAWEVARVVGALKKVVIQAEEAERTMILGAGGAASGNVAQLSAPEREKDESDADWSKRLKEHNQKAQELANDLHANNRQEVELSVRPLKLSLFKDDEKTPADKRRKFSPNDFADLGPFIEDDEEQKAA